MFCLTNESFVFRKDQVSDEMATASSNKLDTMKPLLRIIFFWDEPAQGAQGSILTTPGENATDAECSMVIEYPSAHATMPGADDLFGN